MNGAVLVLVVWLAAVLGVGWLLVRRAGNRTISADDPFPWPSPTGAIAGPTDHAGRARTALALYLMGIGIILAICWPLGLLSHAMESAVDWPTFRWFEARQWAPWSRAWHVLTNIGKPRLTQVIAAVGGIFFAIVWKRRNLNWWAPLAVFVTGYTLEKYMQIALQTLVHRGHPPTTLGTYPSGGCARVLIVYGLVTFSVVSWRWSKSWRAWAIGVTIVMLLWSVQAYARTYNLEHWITDVVGGTVFGLLGLGVMIACYQVLSPKGWPRARAVGGKGRTPKQAARNRTT